MKPVSAEQAHPTMVIAAGAASFDPADISNQARARGCTAVELVVVSESASVDWDAIRAGLSANNLRCAGLSLAGDAYLGAADAGSRSKARDSIVNAIQLAERVGASYVRTVAARLDVANIRYEDAYHHALDALLALRREAGLRGIRIMVHLADHGFITSPTEARRFLDAVNSPWIGGFLNFDFCGSTSATTDWIETLTHRLGAIDMGGPAADALDWAAIGRVIALVRFDGFIVTPIDRTTGRDKRLFELRAGLALPASGV